MAAQLPEDIQLVFLLEHSQPALHLMEQVSPLEATSTTVKADSNHPKTADQH